MQGKDQKTKDSVENNESTTGPMVEQPPTLPFDLSQIDPEKIKLAEKMGIPLQGILEWVLQTEARLTAIQEQLPHHIQNAIEQVIKKAQAEQMQQFRGMQGQGMPQGGGGGMGLMDFFKMFGGGGGMDEELMQLNKDMMRMSIDRMKADIGFSDAIKQAVVTNIAGKAAKKLIEGA